MKRPSFQFYPADWRNNAKLRRCSEAARGVWMDILCVLHDSDEYGVCRWPLADLARAAGASLKLVKELADKDVLKGADKSPPPFTYTPRHAGKDGEPVTLVATTLDPCWYSSRLVRDEWVRLRRGAGTRFDSDNQPPKDRPKQPPKAGIGGRQGDGPTSSSTSTTDSNESVERTRKRFAKPTLAELIAEFGDRVVDPGTEAAKFLNYYESNGWRVGRNPMKSWPHAVTNWVTNCMSRIAPATPGIVEKLTNRDWAGDLA